MTFYLYVTLSEEDKLSTYSMNPDTGDLVLLRELEVQGRPAPLAVDPAKGFMYVGRRDVNQIDSYAIDAGSGGLTLLGTAQLGGHFDQPTRHDVSVHDLGVGRLGDHALDLGEPVGSRILRRRHRPWGDRLAAENLVDLAAGRRVVPAVQLAEHDDSDSGASGRDLKNASMARGYLRVR